MTNDPGAVSLQALVAKLLQKKIRVEFVLWARGGISVRIHRNELDGEFISKNRTVDEDDPNLANVLVTTVSQMASDVDEGNFIH